MGFTVLLCALFALSFAVGHLVGPVSVGAGHQGGGSLPGMPGMDMNGLGAPLPARVTGIVQ